MGPGDCCVAESEDAVLTRALREGERFSKTIGDHIFGWYIFDIDAPFFHLLSNP